MSCLKLHVAFANNLYFFLLKINDTQHSSNKKMADVNFSVGYDTNIFINLIIEVKSELYCTNCSEICKESVITNNVNPSKNIKNECEYKLNQCKYSGCNQLLNRQQLSKHLEICEYKTFKCINCNEIIEFNKQSIHKNQCINQDNKNSELFNGNSQVNF